ncbi:unnamed protein product [Chrysoparadoxa australica]
MRYLLRRGLTRGRCLSTAVASEFSAPAPAHAAAVRAEAASLTDGGLSVDLQFDDGCKFRIKARWLADALPSRHGNDFHRVSAEGVGYLSTVHATGVSTDTARGTVKVSWSGAISPEEDTIPGVWLRAYAPAVGQALNDQAAAAVKDHSEDFGATSAPFKGCFSPAEKGAVPWLAHEVEVPMFEYEELESDEAKLHLLKCMANPGLAFIDGLPKAEDGAEPAVRTALRKFVGKFAQHPSRQNWWELKSGQVTSSRDYNFSLPLAMHTDHSIYPDTPCFLLCMHQVKGEATGKIADGMAIVEALKKEAPEVLEILSSVRVDHGLRHRLYNLSGGKRDIFNETEEPDEFELYGSEPLINLNADGTLRKIRHSETKRLPFSVPADQFDDVLAAYDKFCQLVEEPRFRLTWDWPENRLVVFNNHRLLHGRASIKSQERILLGGSVTKTITSLKYRLLRMKIAGSRLGLERNWVSRLPDPVLANLAKNAGV